MGLAKAQIQQRAINEVIKYVLEHGKKVENNIILWDTYPICVQDICVDGAAVVDNKLIWCDYDHKTKEFTNRKTGEETETMYIKQTLADMQSIDSK